MSFSSIPRFLPSSFGPKKCNFSALIHSTDSFADKYWDHLQKNGGNLERTLGTVCAKLDSSIVCEVLRRCSGDLPLLGLRFFIWAGLQSNYRHSSYMYSEACKLFHIKRNPRALADVIEAYRVEGCSIGVRTFKMVLSICREAKLAEESLWVLRKMVEFNCQPDTTAYNVVIRLFCEKGDLDMAAGLTKEMCLVDLYPDMITYVAMIKGFCGVGRLEDACELFKLMKRHGCSPNRVAYSALLDGVCRFGTKESALEFLLKMEKEGGSCSPNVVTYTTVIQSFCEKGLSVEAMSILDQMGARGCGPNRVTVSILIKGLCAEGRVEDAYKLIDKVVAGGSVSNGECYSSLVVSLLRVRKLEEAEKLFRWMLATALKPDGLACSILIKELCLEGRVLDGFSLYNEIEKMGCLSSIDSEISSILLVGLCEQSHLGEATELARLMLERGVSLKAPFAENIVEHLNKYGERDLVLQLIRVGN